MTVPAILRHVWGKSPYVDRVWGMVAGMRPSAAEKALLMVTQAYLDDSSTPWGYFVVAGHVANVSQWAKFTAEWEKLLPLAPMGNSGIRRFKLSEFGKTPEDFEIMSKFYRVLEEYVALSISIRMKHELLENAKRRVEAVLPIPMRWRFFNSPYDICFKVLMDTFHKIKAEFDPEIPLDEKVDFIFDNQKEKAEILRIWDRYVESQDEGIRKFFGTTPRFEDEEHYLPLQAADLWAGATRRWSEGDETMRRLRESDFGPFRGERQHHVKFDIDIDEDWLVKFMLQVARTKMPDALIYDLDLAIARVGKTV